MRVLFFLFYLSCTSFSILINSALLKRELYNLICGGRVAAGTCILDNVILKDNDPAKGIKPSVRTGIY